MSKCQYNQYICIDYNIDILSIQSIFLQSMPIYPLYLFFIYILTKIVDYIHQSIECAVYLINLHLLQEIRGFKR